MEAGHTISLVRRAGGQPTKTKTKTAIRTATDVLLTNPRGLLRASGGKSATNVPNGAMNRIGLGPLL